MAARTHRSWIRPLRALAAALPILVVGLAAPAAAYQGLDHPGVEMAITGAVRHADGNVTASGWALCPPGEDWGVGFHLYESLDQPDRRTGMAALSAPVHKVICDGESHPWTARSQKAHAGGIQTDGEKYWEGKMQSPTDGSWVHKDKGDAGTVHVVSADLSLTLADSPDPVSSGQPLTYTLDALNAGPGEATDVQLTDQLPSTVELQSAGASCQHDGAAAGGTVTCDLGSLAPSGTSTVEIVVIPSAPGTVANSASIASSSTGPHGEATGVGDPNTSNNSATETTIVEPAAESGADLSLTKADSPDPVVVGGTLTYTVAVTNAGPAVASSVVMNDPLPANLRFRSVTTTHGKCGFLSGSRTVKCSFGDLASGVTATAEIVVAPSASGTLTNTATVSSGTSDPKTSNNSATETTTVNP